MRVEAVSPRWAVAHKLPGATPEIREYRIRAVIDDEEIGDYSVTKQITVS